METGRQHITVERLTLLIAFFTLVGTLTFGLFPRPAVLPKRDRNIAYIEDAPVIHILNSAVSTDVSGQLRYHLVYKEPPSLKIGDVLSFRGVVCAVVFVEMGKGLSDDTDPTRTVAMCRVIGGA